ncbi:MAG: hypothetical protein WKF84_13590 [Pyrinomonadaceae bacterium]
MHDQQQNVPCRTSVAGHDLTLDGRRHKVRVAEADSVVMTDNLATVAEKSIERMIGTIEMSEVDEALRYTLGLSQV